MPPPIVPGWTAVHSATSDGNPVALRRVLAEHRGDLDAVDLIGRSPLHLAFAMGPAGAMAAHALLESGAALLPLGPIPVDHQRRRIQRHAGDHPHRRAVLAAALWAAELGLRPKALRWKPSPADVAWATPLAALVAPEAMLRVAALLGAWAPAP